MTRSTIVLLLAALCGAPFAQAQSYESQCRLLASLSFPDAHRAPAAALAALAQCSSTRLYYGIGMASDPVRARQCALAATDGDQPFNEGRGVLMMVYANGQGVASDYVLARKAACEAGGAPAEIAGRLAHLGEMEAGRKGAAPSISVCDDATSGYMGGWCAALSRDLKEQQRGTAFARLIAPWNTQQKQAFARLESRARAFIETRASLEIDLSGTARAALTIHEESRQLEDFRASVAAFERGALPGAGQAEYARLDARLNAVYRELKGLPAPRFGTIGLAGIQQTQRAWLVYREAWVVFGKVRYPGVAPESWRAWLTRKRIAMLENLAVQLRLDSN